ncbi:hypothetical protein PybrP1_006283 [[Pythium] brassicae (nom. inval.)]|nr:hypothetical protein PybrP1_006283 [[Pythium] brassicae (nom. inval.)]
MYSRPELVRWLLLHGADRDAPCYLKQTALDLVGECCEHTVVVPAGSRAAASAECRKLLQEPPTLPFPPGGATVRVSSTFSTEVVLVRAPVAPTTATRQQKIFRCLVHVAWEAPLSNGALIDRYEVRYRPITADDADADSSGAGPESWRLERASHNRKSREQQLLLAGLQFDTRYEVALRAWSAAGKGEWGRGHKFTTRASPEQL